MECITYTCANQQTKKDKPAHESRSDEPVVCARKEVTDGGSRIGCIPVPYHPFGCGRFSLRCLSSADSPTCRSVTFIQTLHHDCVRTDPGSAKGIMQLPYIEFCCRICQGMSLRTKAVRCSQIAHQTDKEKTLPRAKAHLLDL